MRFTVEMGSLLGDLFSSREVTVLVLTYGYLAPAVVSNDANALVVALS